jgi:hypothetical protein
MKNSPLISILLAVLALSALCSVVLCWVYIQNSREFRSLQGQANYINSINNRRAGLTALINDALDYSKTNRAIDPILESVGAKPKPGATNSNKAPNK